MKIFYHNDNDGKAAASMVYCWAMNNKIDELSKDDFIEVNYNTSIPDASLVNENELVFIVDYSFTKATVNTLLDIINKTKKVVWYDHHISSVEVFDDIKYLCASVIIDIDRSGAMIAFDELIANNSYDMVEYFNYIDYNIFDIKYMIELVDDYDRWVHANNHSLLFNIGSTLYDTHPMNFWKIPVNEAVEQGNIINKYNTMKNNSLCKSNSYIIKINGHECIVMNTPEASSKAFADYYDQYKFAIRYAFNGNNFSYSIYSSLEDIDCSKIAKHFNIKGGGHKGAAGFVSDKLLFSDGCVFII